MQMMASPEPMSLGSPGQSPTGQYLPQFLLGDLSLNNSSQLNPRNTSKFWVGGASPPRSASIGRSFSMNQHDINNKFNNTNSNLHDKSETIYNSFYNNSSIHQTSSHGNFNSNHHHNNHHNHHHHHNNLDRTQEMTRPGAPPLNRLVDTINKSVNLTPTLNFNNTESRSKFNHTELYDSKNMTQDLSFTPNRISPPSPTQIDPFYTQGESIKTDDNLDETWVTVYGFPASALSYVLQEFSICGLIVKHVPSTQGNWMHIQFQAKFHAQKALSKNGKILANSIMIGVLPCIDKNVMQQHQGKENFMKTTNNNSSSLLKDVANKNTGVGGEFLQPGSRIQRTTSLRNATRPSLAGLNRNDKDFDANMPRKNTNVISKAMEYMFGW